MAALSIAGIHQRSKRLTLIRLIPDNEHSSPLAWGLKYHALSLPRHLGCVATGTRTCIRVSARSCGVFRTCRCKSVSFVWRTEEAPPTWVRKILPRTQQLRCTLSVRPCAYASRKPTPAGCFRSASADGIFRRSPRCRPLCKSRWAPLPQIRPRQPFLGGVPLQQFARAALRLEHQLEPRQAGFDALPVGVRD